MARATPARPAWGSAVLLTMAVLHVGVGMAQGPTQQPMTSGQRQDREALIALKSAVAPGGFGTSKLKSWKAGGNPCNPKPWPGVSCEQGRVTSLALSNMGIQATLPIKLRQLNKLTSLKLDGNKFTGSIPPEWADSRYFMSLQTLVLADNLLEGALPSQAWNKKKAFRSLQFMDLSSNQFRGGLPYGWLSTNRVFKQLKFLDLSGNLLGQDLTGTQYATTAGWCTAGPGTLGTNDAKVGWCPTGAPLADAMAGLETLDLSDNALQGMIPPSWPLMFPNLQHLLLAGNNLWALGSSTVGKPAGLPSGWTQSTYPIAFPALSTLTLYPGNPLICNLPQAQDFGFQGWAEVNPDNTYRIMDTQTTEFNAQNPRTCGEPINGNNPVVGIDLRLENNALTALWTGPAAPQQDAVFGYRVTLVKYNPESDEWDLVPQMNAKLFRTYRDAAFVSIPASWGLNESVFDRDPPVYKLKTGINAAAATKYTIEITSFNMDGQESTPRASLQQSFPVTAPEPTPCATAAAGTQCSIGGYNGQCVGGGSNLCQATGCNGVNQGAPCVLYYGGAGNCTAAGACQGPPPPLVQAPPPVCPIAPCKAYAVSDAQSGNKVPFTNPATNSTYWPAGNYQIFYERGCLDYNRWSRAGNEWCVGFQETAGQYWKGHFVEYQVTGGTVGQKRLFNDPTMQIPDICSFDYTECVVNAQKALTAPTTFTHGGGAISIYFTDNPYVDNVAGTPSPVWRLEAISGCTATMPRIAGSCCANTCWNNAKACC